jgi:hypothetical protein
LAHSITAASGVVTGVVRLTAQWESYWRAVALDLRTQQIRPGITPADRLSLSALEILAWLLVGAITGAAAGYLSHLALDGCTPAGLPLLGSCNAR